MAKNKVKYGLKNVHYAVASIDETTNAATYGTPKPWPGGVSLSLDAEGDVTKFRADNIDYWVGQSNNGYSGSLESALVPESFKKDILGELEDANGVWVENQGAKTVPFALLFQFEGDQNAVRHVMYNCTASRPSVSGETTDTNIEPQTESVELTASSIYNASLDKDLVKARVNQGDTPYSTWFNAVYQPSALATYVKLTFDTDGGTAIPAQDVRSGAKPVKPEDPVKAGYEFGGWYEEDTFTTAFNFNAVMSADATAYAKFTPEA